MVNFNNRQKNLCLFLSLSLWLTIKPNHFCALIHILLLSTTHETITLTLIKKTNTPLHSNNQTNVHLILTKHRTTHETTSIFSYTNSRSQDGCSSRSVVPQISSRARSFSWTSLILLTSDSQELDLRLSVTSWLTNSGVNYYAASFNLNPKQFITNQVQQYRTVLICREETVFLNSKLNFAIFHNRQLTTIKVFKFPKFYNINLL